MKTILLAAAVILAACGGDGGIDLSDQKQDLCPGPFASYMTLSGTCPDPTSALVMLKLSGVNVATGSLKITVMDANSWGTWLGGATVNGLTTETDTFIDEKGDSLLHELIHTSERPLIDTDHTGWREKGYCGLDNLYRWTLGVNTALWEEQECLRPLLTDAQETALRAAGFDLDKWRSDACQEKP